jgi:hypothetical protein
MNVIWLCAITDRLGFGSEIFKAKLDEIECIEDVGLSEIVALSEITSNLFLFPRYLSMLKGMHRFRDETLFDVLILSSLKSIQPTYVLIEVD